MGGRSGPSNRQILGSGRGRKSTARLEDKLLSGGAKVVANAAFQTAAASNPVIGAAYLAYEAAKFTYPIVKKGVDVYQKTGDRDRALEKMSEETVKQAGKKVVETAVGNVVNTAVDGAIKNANINADKTATTFVKAALTETIGNLIE